MKRFPPLYYYKPYIATKADFTSEVFELFSDFKVLPARGLCAIIRMVVTFGIAYGIDDQGLQVGRWCYSTYKEAKEAFDNWTGVGDPPGMWAKYKGRGGYEYINPLRIKEHVEYRGKEKEYYETTLSLDWELI